MTRHDVYVEHWHPRDTWDAGCSCGWESLEWDTEVEAQSTAKKAGHQVTSGESAGAPSVHRRPAEPAMSGPREDDDREYWVDNPDERTEERFRPPDPPAPRWVCGVVSSGFHNGAGCDPDDPHSGWDCGWQIVIRIPVAAP